MYDFTGVFDAPDSEIQPSGARNTASTAVRAVGERSQLIGALIARLGSGALSAPGGYVGASISGAGEVLAQMIENGSMDLSKIKKGRVGVEAGIGMIPFAKTISAGKALMSALKGGAISFAGTVGRKAADAASEGSLEPLKNWSKEDAIPTVLGAGLSGALGKISKSGPAPPKDYVIEPTAQLGGQIKNPEKGGGVIPVQVISPIKGSGELPPKIAPRAGATFEPDSISYPGTNVQTASSARKEGQEIAHAARNQKAREAYQRKIEKARADADIEEATRNMAAGNMATGLEPKPPTVTESGSYTPDGGVRVGTSQRYAAPKVEGDGPGPRPLPNRITPDERKGLSAMTPERASSMLNRDLDEMVQSGELIKTGNNYRINPQYGKRPRAKTEAGGTLPATTVAPREGIFQVLTPDGKIIEMTDEAATLDLVNTLGPKATVIPPPSVAAPRTSRPTKLKGTANQIIEQQEALAAKAATKTASASARIAKLAESETGANKLEDLEKITGASIQTPASARGTIPVTAGSPVPEAARITGDPVGPLSAQAKMQALGYNPKDMVKMSAKEVHEIIANGVRKAPPVAPAPAASIAARPTVGEQWAAAPSRVEADAAVEAVFQKSFPEPFYRAYAPLSRAYNVTLDLTAQATTATEKAFAKVARLKALTAMNELSASAVAKGEVTQEVLDDATRQVRAIRAASRAPALKAPPKVPSAASPTRSSAAPIASTPEPRAATPIARSSSDPEHDAMLLRLMPGSDPETVRLREQMSREWSNSLRTTGLSPNKSAQTSAAPVAIPPKAPTSVPPTVDGLPIPPELAIREKALLDQLAVLRESGNATSPKFTKVVKDLMKVKEEIFKATDPEGYARRMAEQAAAKAAPKGKAKPPGISANPFFDPEAYRWAGQSLGPEGIGGLVGAGIGGMTSEDDPLGGALLGGLAGAVSGKAYKGIRDSGLYPEAGPEGLSFLDRLINWQRFALLSNPENLAVNFAAPTSSSALSSIEKILAGSIERTGIAGPITNNLELGTAGLKRVLNPRRLGNLKEDASDATRLIAEAERADLARGGRTATTFDKFIRLPADVLTTGDIGARKALMEAGWSEEMARLATVTSNPRYGLGEWIANMGKSGPGRFLLPFSRTAANVLEGSLERTPVVGLLMHMTQKNPELKASVAEIAAQQGMGGLVSVASYMLGSSIDPETARERKWPLYLTNLSGQYGALAAAAFAAGQTSQRDDSTGAQIRSAGYSLSGDVPLPTTQPVSDIVNTFAAYTDGQPPNPNAISPFEQWLPPMLTPRFLRDDVLKDYPGTPQYDYEGIF